MSSAKGQRVRKPHPEGGLAGDGTSPRKTMQSLFCMMSVDGIAERRDFV